MTSQPDEVRSAASRLQRDLDLLRQCARVSVQLREAVDRVEQELQRYEIARQEDEIHIAEALARIERQTNHIADLREGCYTANVRAKRAERALGEIEGKARWYADNLQRDPHEVDHALCVEILDLARKALDD